MKKKILFLCSNMDIGGFQKSLVSLLRCLDYEKYEVDLLLFNPTGIFMDLIPKEVNILPTVIEPEYFASGKNAVLAMLKKGKLWEALVRLISCGLWVFDKSIGAACMIQAVPGVRKDYDAAIDYNGQHILYYMVDKICAKRNISFFHSDYQRWPYYKRADRKYYRKVDAIVTVSDECVASMKSVFPEYSEKIHCIENINSGHTVNLFPPNDNPFADDFDGERLVTVGRICKDKGLDFVFEALNKLCAEGYQVKWYLVGPLTERAFYQEMIKQYGNTDQLVLLGATSNPYDYMRNADIIVHPSRFEGKAVAVEEAKILRKPIVATNFSTVHDQIIDGETGLIVDMNGQAVYEGIKRLLDDRALYQHIVETQERTCFGNESEVEKLYKLIEG